jgi:hypothetical protein
MRTSKQILKQVVIAHVIVCVCVVQALNNICGRVCYLMYQVKIEEIHIKSKIGFNATFSNIKAVSFINGGNRNTRRKPSIGHKSLTNFDSEILGWPITNYIHVLWE